MATLTFIGSDASGASGYTDVLTLTLTQTQPGVNAAPSAIWFECSSVSNAQAQPPQSGEVYDPQYHEIVYLWTFDDAANAVPRTALNMPDAWKDINKGYGRRVVHCYNDPGTYTVTCYSYEPATQRFGSETISVTIADPDTVFPAGQTIVYDPDGTADVSGLSSPDVKTSWAQVMSARNALGTSNNARILFAPGAVLTLRNGDPDIDTNAWSNLRLGALDMDNPNRPSIVSSGRQGFGPGKSLVRDWGEYCSETVLYGVDLVGEWDSTTETGRMVSPFSIYQSQQTGDSHLFLMHRAKVSGFVSLWAQIAIPQTALAYAMYSDMSVTNWQDYGIISGNDDPRFNTALVGVSSAQNVDALSGGKKNGMHNNHGAWRDFSSIRAYASVCDFFSRTGWSAGGSYGGNIFPVDQAAIRINTSGGAGRESYLDRVSAEGYIWYEEQGRTNVDRPGNHVIDKMLQVGGSRHTLSQFVMVSYGGFTARNYLGIKLGRNEAGGTVARFFGLNNGSGDPQNGPAGVRVYNSTGIDLRSDTQALDRNVDFAATVQAPYSVQFLENNLFHEPNRSGSVPVTGVTVDAGTAIAGYSIRHKGPRFNFAHEEADLPVFVSGAGGTFTIPYSQITDQLVNLNNTDNGTPTDQAYWQAIENIDTRHRISVGGDTWHADQNEIDVTFGATGVTITNNSTVDWVSGATYQLRLDRASLIPDYDPQYDNTSQDLTIPIQATDANILQPADMALRAYDDFFGVERPISGDSRGAI
jgi:hypothetical protein